MGKYVVRIALCVLGVALVLLALLNPLSYEDNLEINGEQETMPVFSAGQVLEQPLHVPASMSQFSLRVNSVKEVKALTLDVTVLSGGKAAAEIEFPLEKVRTKGRLICDLPSPLAAGDYTLRVEARGEGSVTLLGGAESAAAVDGGSWDLGCYVRMTCNVEKRSTAAVFCGAVLVLLGLTPGGGKEKKHARV
ncbi:MAG: hypothetical protein IJ507_04245 [Clostridia bacterium]|nr:hypothetical protein [Clostridia bacterium]